MSMVKLWLRKDLSRVRWLLLGWVLALLFEQAWAWLYLADIDSLHALACKGFAAVGSFAAWTLALLMTGLIVLQDPLSGFSPFWLGRPVSKYQLHLAKLSAVLLFALVPALLEALFPAFLGLGAGAVLLGIAHSVLVHSAVLLAAALFASLSENFAGFAVRSVLMLIGGSLSWGFASGVNRGWVMSSHGMPLEPTLIDSSRLVLLVGLVVLSLVFLVLRYGDRHSRTLAQLPYLGLVVLVCGSCLWRWDFIGALRYSASGETEAGRPVFELGPQALSQERSRSNLITLRGSVAVLEMTAGEFIVPRGLYQVKLRSAKEGAGALRTMNSLLTPSLVSAQPLWAPAALEASLGGLKVLNQGPVPELRLPVCILREEVVAKATEGGTSLDAGVSALRVRYRVVAELPLRERAEVRGSGLRVRIESIDTKSAVSVIRLREDRFVTDFLAESRGQKANPVNLGRCALNPFQQWPLLHVLVNRARGEALVVRRAVRSDTLEFGELRLGERTLRPEWGQELGQAEREAWLAGASLVCVGLEELGPVAGVLKAEAVQLRK